MERKVFKGFDYQYPDQDLKENIMKAINQANRKKKKTKIWLSSCTVAAAGILLFVSISYQQPDASILLHRITNNIKELKNGATWDFYNGLLKTPKNMDGYKDSNGEYILGFFASKGGSGIDMALAAETFDNQVVSTVETYRKPILSKEQMLALAEQFQGYIGGVFQVNENYDASIFGSIETPELMVEGENAQGHASIRVSRGGNVHLLHTINESIDTEVIATNWIQHSWISEIYDLNTYNFETSSYQWGEATSIEVLLKPKEIKTNEKLETISISFVFEDINEYLVSIALPGPVDLLESHTGFTENEIYAKTQELYGDDITIVGFQYGLLNDPYFADIVIPYYVIGIQDPESNADTYSIVFIGSDENSHELIRKAQLQ